MRALNLEDTHFYIDNAPPEEVAWVLRCMQADAPMSAQAIGDRVANDYGFQMQKDRTYSPRRLYDLGLAVQAVRDGRALYALSGLGLKVRDILATGSEVYADVMHFLHYSRYGGLKGDRKYLWSYRQCCHLVWEAGRPLPRHEVAGTIQGLMKRDFPHLDYQAPQGARFDSTAVGRCYAWLAQLSPSPFSQEHTQVQPRVLQRPELALLALDYAYTARRYRYGDPVVLDDALLGEVSRVFFLDPVCCRELVDLASRVTRLLTLRATFAGMSVNLLAHYGVEDM